MPDEIEVVSTRRLLEQLLAKADDDGYTRATRVIYDKADGRQRIPWREKWRLLSGRRQKRA